MKAPSAVVMWSALLLSAVAATLFAAANFWLDTLSGAALAWLANLGVTLSIMVLSVGRAIAEWRSQGRLIGTGSLVIATLSLAAVTVPAASLVWRSRIATVERLLQQQIGTQEALIVVLWIFTACLVAFWIGERVSAPSSRSRLRTRSRALSLVRLDMVALMRSASSVMLAVGFTTNLLQLIPGIGANFATRGEAQGQGLFDMAGWSLSVGIAVAVLHRHWGSRWRLVASGFGVVVIALSAVRSPLVLVALAFVPQIVSLLARSTRPALIWVGVAAGGSALVGLGSALNLWRGQIRRGQDVSLLSTIGQSMSDPFSALLTAGIDTVDGLLFVRWLPDGAVEANILDLSKAVLYLIPRQLFPGKPELISNVLSREYLGFGTAGMFLSGPGYLYLIAGGVIGAIIGFGLYGMVHGRVFSARGSSVFWLLGTYVLVRFYMGGDAIDFFKGLQLGLIVLIALAIVRVFLPMRNGGRLIDDDGAQLGNPADGYK